MNIVIVGSGNVGRALADGWKKAGHSVTFAAREPGGAKAAELKKDGFAVRRRPRPGRPTSSCSPCHGPASDDVKALGSLAGKIVIDATNPLTANLELALGFSDSAGETVARLAPARRS